MKSKYPNQIDTPSELPIIRDGITEISSDIINSLRGAILQIEKTLGVNPQGAAGNTVSSRIDSVIDDSGNIKKEALTKSGILFGPLLNDQVSSVAAIDESKLKLNFPTNVLQSEISSLSLLIGQIQNQIEYLSSIFSAHVNPASTKRHFAKAINSEDILIAPSIIGIKNIESDNLQNILTAVVNNHFNYTGDSISPENNSHSAEQIYFDNNNVSSAITSQSVQGALEEIAGGSSIALESNLSYLTKNGIARFGKTSDIFEDSDFGEILLNQTPVSFSPSTSSVSTIGFSLSPTILGEISKFDILTLSNSTDSNDNKSFYIYDIVTSGTTLIEAKVYGRLFGLSSSSAIVSIRKNPYKNLNENNLNTAVRLRNGFSNTPDIIVSNPNSATATSVGLRVDLLSSIKNSFKIQVDNYLPIEINCYNSLLGSNQTVDSIVDKINESLSSNKIPAYCFKVKNALGYELSISHIVPNFSGDTTERIIKISSASTNNATDILGFNHILDKENYGLFGNSLFINGKIFKDYQKILTFTKALVSITIGTTKITSNSIDLLKYDIRVGDAVVITGASNSTDDGLYFIKSISSTEITLDAPASFTFTGTLSLSSSILFIRTAVPVNELNFEEVSGTSGFALIDIFADNNREFYYSKRAEISGALSSVGFNASIVDISKNFILKNEVYLLKVKTDGFAYLEDSLGQTGEETYIGTTSGQIDSIFNIKSPGGFGFVSIRVIATALPTALLSCTIYGYNEVSKDSLILSRCLFSNATGRIFGSTGTGSVTQIIDKRNFGNIDIEQVCPSFIEKYIEGPRNEIRSAGIVRGCLAYDLSSGSDSLGPYFTFSISQGVYYSNGIRKEFAGVENFKTYYSSPFFIHFNEHGDISISAEVTINSYLKSASINKKIPYLAYKAASGLTDLRFFINDIDKKLSTSIIVAEDISNGHFSDLASAVKYGEIISKTNGISNQGPSILIKEGIYTISEPIIFSYDANISGSGKNTILKRSADLSDCSSFSNRIPDPEFIPFIIGKNSNTNSEMIKRGITFKDFCYESTELTDNSSTSVFLLAQERNFNGNNSVFIFENLSLIGPSNRGLTNYISEFMLYISQISNSGTENNSVDFGNIIIKSCFMSNIGSDASGILAAGSEEALIVEVAGVGTYGSGRTIKNIIATGNIAINTLAGYSTHSPSILRTTYISATTFGIIESSNAIS